MRHLASNLLTHYLAKVEYSTAQLFIHISHKNYTSEIISF